MVQTPFALKAARDLSRAPRGCEERGELPVRATKILNVREARQQQAGDEGTQRKHDAAHKRFLPNVDDGESGPHNSLL